ncbi:MAG: hypothetical protein AB7I33_03140 [Gemmatimonadales bacterium]
MHADLHWMVWLVIPFVIFGIGSARRGRRSLAGPDFRRERDELLQELDDQRGYMEGLEERVAELENRLDFTERLLAGEKKQ